MTSGTTVRETGEKTLIGLMSAGHFFSHFFFLALPPLYPLLKQEFGVSYTLLGGITATYATCTAISQYPVGILADRFGARAFLIAGLTLISVCAIAMGLGGSIVWLYALAAVAGLADGVFHPCDYAILSARVGAERSGRAFSIHTLGGFAGFGMAPVIMVPLAAALGWQWALICSGLAGLLAVGAMLWYRDKLDIDEPAQAGAESQVKGAPASQVLACTPLLLMFGFYAFSSTANTGLMAHLVSILMEGNGWSFETAGSVLPAYLWGLIAGVLAGGFAADYFKRVELTATVGTLLAGLLVFAAAVLPMPVALALVVFFLAGMGYGGTLPSRDVVVRAVAPPGGTGQAFGFVSTGYSIGGTLGPVLIGWILDQGATRIALAIPAALLVAAMLFTLSAIRAGGAGRRSPQPAE